MFSALCIKEVLETRKQKNSQNLKFLLAFENGTKCWWTEKEVLNLGLENAHLLVAAKVRALQEPVEGGEEKKGKKKEERKVRKNFLE